LQPYFARSPGAGGWKWHAITYTLGGAGNVSPEPDGLWLRMPTLYAVVGDDENSSSVVVQQLASRKTLAQQGVPGKGCCALHHHEIQGDGYKITN
jgi:hypothetical protein